jgi:hypothetical protein
MPGLIRLKCFVMPVVVSDIRDALGGEACLKD